MKPLSGITVLEFSTMITASLSSMIMAEQGARVIKVEPIAMGDPMRYLGTSKGGISALFANCNRGKQSIRIDIREAAGQDLINMIVKEVDVVVHNFRPGVMNRLNLGSDQLREINPKLIYVAISGFGLEGPYANSPAYDPIIQAHAGMTASQGHGEPAFVRNLMCDKVTALTAVQAMTAALFVRERTKVGQHIDLSMLDAGLFFIFPDGFMNHTLLDDDVVLQPLLADLIYDLSKTKDGAITFSAPTDQQRAGVARALNRADLIDDPRFDSIENWMKNMGAYKAELRAAFLEMTTEDILSRLRDEHVPAARCHDYEDVMSQAQIRENESVKVSEHPLMGSMRVVQLPAKFEGKRLSAGSHAPAHGQDTDTILKQFGISTEELTKLKKNNIVL